MAEMIECEVTADIQDFVSWDDLMTMPGTQFREWWLRGGGKIVTVDRRNAPHGSTESVSCDVTERSA
jgi:hypothetical protein